uniref:Putative endonuclease/exonuclease/phosphatase n=1 Tax=Arachis duranensis TaxID=130453 RepID=N1NFY0_ARADU|nr:putative endonuclease/exonuclease/phosphatase [Arachis duranensis]
MAESGRVPTRNWHPRANEDNDMEQSGFGKDPNSEEEHRNNQYLEIFQRINAAGEHYLLIGDFNAIRGQHEKEGGTQKSASSITGFNGFMDGDSLRDIGYESCKFTCKLKNYRYKLVEWQSTNPNNSAKLIVELTQKLEAEKQKAQLTDKRLISTEGFRRLREGGKQNREGKREADTIMYPGSVALCNATYIQSPPQ